MTDTYNYYKSSGRTQPNNDALFIASTSSKVPGLSEFGLRAEGIEIRPGMDKKIPSLKAVKACPPRLARL